jgi:CRISPR/Cas system-associated exonuclease Cas4 (RecB family)
MSELEKMMYEMFAEVYYERIYKTYLQNEIRTTETTQCLTKSFFQRKIPRMLLEPKMVVLSFGTLIHEGLRKPLQKRGYKTEEEGTYPIKDVTLYAHTDALGKDHTLEFKTISRMPHDPLSHHVLQDNAYNFVFDRPIGYLVYIHKPSGLVRCFPVPKREDQFQYVCLRALRLSIHLKSNVMPIPEPSWLCYVCEYTDLCSNPLKKMRKKWV